MKAKKNFEKKAILKRLGLVSFWGIKTHFGKIPLKWCIFRLEKINSLSNILLYPLIQLRFLHTKHLKRTIWISVLWKISMLLPKKDHKRSENDFFVKDINVVGEKWPEMVVKWPNLKVVSFFTHKSILEHERSSSFYLPR